MVTNGRTSSLYYLLYYKRICTEKVSLKPSPGSGALNIKWNTADINFIANKEIDEVVLKSDGRFCYLYSGRRRLVIGARRA